MDEISKKVSDFYTKNFNKYGSSPKSMGWKDQASQLLRFEKLVQLIDREEISKGISVNDFGCGYGAMFLFLRERIELKQYYGYDISEIMVESAKQTIKDPRAEFINSSKIIYMADYSFASGTFTVKLDTTDKVWEKHVKKNLMMVADKSIKGFAFNMLSTYVDWKSKDVYYADPFFFFDFCKRNISKYVSLLHDYPLFEWTILIKKERIAK